MIENVDSTRESQKRYSKEGVAVGRIIRELTKEEQEENQKEIYSIIDRICSESYREDFEVRFNKDNKVISFFTFSSKYPDFSLQFFVDRIYPKTIVWGKFEANYVTDSKDLKALNLRKEFNQVLEFMAKVESKLSVIEF